MKKSVPFFIFLFTTVFIAQGQEAFKIELNRVAFPVLFKKINSMPALNMYDLNTSCMSKLKEKIIYPVLDFVPADTAYAEISRRSTGVQAFHTEFYFLICNYTAASPVLFASSSPHDFSDAQRFELPEGKVIRFPFKTNAGTTINYYLKKEKADFLQDSPFRYNCDIVNADYLIAKENDFAKAGDYKQKNKGFSICIFDANQDGIFNERGVDKISIGKAEERYYPVYHQDGEAISTHSVQESMIIEVNGEKFELLEVDRSGAYVSLRPYKGKTMATIRRFDAMPDVNVELMTGDSMNLKQLVDNKHYVFIRVWWKSCPACIQELPELESLSEKYKDKLTVVKLLDKGDLKQLKELTEKYQLKTKQALANEESNRNLVTNGYPYGVLFGPRGELIEVDVTLSDVVKCMEK